MKKLIVHYDASCGFCVRCRAWLEAQPKFIELEFAPSPGAEELVVEDEDGRVYRGAKAWVMCLYALRDYRAWAFTLSNPMLWPLARKFFSIVSANRRLLSPAAAAEEAGEAEEEAAAPCPVRPEASPSERPRHPL